MTLRSVCYLPWDALCFFCAETQRGDDNRYFQNTENSSQKQYKTAVKLAFADCFALSSILFSIPRAWMLLCVTAGCIQYKEVIQYVILYPSYTCLCCYNRKLPTSLCLSLSSCSKFIFTFERTLNCLIPLVPSRTCHT